MLLCGRIFLGARCPHVIFPRIWASKDFAHEVHTLGWFLAMDPFFPEFWFGARCSWRIWRRVLIPIFLLHVEKIFSDKNLETHNPILETPSIMQLILSHHLSLFFCWASPQPQHVGIGIFRHICIRSQTCSFDTREDSRIYMTNFENR